MFCSCSDVLLLQDNATVHTSQVAMTAATECGFEILPHPPYCPDMALSDFYLFSKLNSHLRCIVRPANKDWACQTELSYTVK